MHCRSQVHRVHVVHGAQVERVRQQRGQVVVVVAGQLVVQARQRVTCGVWQPKARIARIAPTGRIGGVRGGETCGTKERQYHP